MATCNTVPLTDDLVLLWRTKSGWQYVEIDVDSIPWVNEADVCECLEDCEKIKALDAKDANLQSQINDLNNQTDKLREKDDDLQDQIDNINDKDESQDNIINNIPFQQMYWSVFILSVSEIYNLFSMSFTIIYNVFVVFSVFLSYFS